jgi:CMP-N-acetylneuraminic acid synthetase
MTNGFLAIIPARGGSKRIPRKNLADLAGRPLLHHTLEAAERSRFIDAAVLSSDDAEILAAAGDFPKTEALLRPAALATDTAATADVLLDVLDVLERRGRTYRYLVLLQPTSPLRTAAMIDAAAARMLEKKADGLISVTKADPSPLWCNVLGKDGDMSAFLHEDLKSVRSQDLPDYYALNGCIFIAGTERFRKEKTFFLRDNVTSFVMEKRDSADIDTPEDMEYADFLMRRRST